MKRSEMLKSVRNDLIDILGNSPKVVNDITNPETLELILDLLESKGIQSPLEQLGFATSESTGPSRLDTTD